MQKFTATIKISDGKITREYVVGDAGESKRGTFVTLGRAFDKAQVLSGVKLYINPEAWAKSDKPVKAK